MMQDQIKKLQEQMEKKSIRNPERIYETPKIGESLRRKQTEEAEKPS